MGMIGSSASILQGGFRNYKGVPRLPRIKLPSPFNYHIRSVKQRQPFKFSHLFLAQLTVLMVVCSYYMVGVIWLNAESTPILSTRQEISFEYVQRQFMTLEGEGSWEEFGYYCWIPCWKNNDVDWKIGLLEGFRNATYTGVKNCAYNCLH